MNEEEEKEKEEEKEEEEEEAFHRFLIFTYAKEIAHPVNGSSARNVSFDPTSIDKSSTLVGKFGLRFLCCARGASLWDLFRFLIRVWRTGESSHFKRTKSDRCIGGRREGARRITKFFRGRRRTRSRCLINHRKHGKLADLSRNLVVVVVVVVVSLCPYSNRFRKEQRDCMEYVNSSGGKNFWIRDRVEEKSSRSKECSNLAEIN